MSIFEPFGDDWKAYAQKVELERFGSSSTELPDQEVLESAKLAQARRHLKAETEHLQSVREQRDKIFFNAGRYMAGARDSVAVASYGLFEVLMDRELE